MQNLKYKIIKGNVKIKCYYHKVSDVLCKYSSLLFTMYDVMTVACNGVSYINCKSIYTRTMGFIVDCMAI
jgi:hypothetical protein